jgi:hypothetical protein
VGKESLGCLRFTNRRFAVRFFRDQTRYYWFVEGNTAQDQQTIDYCTALKYEHSDLTPRVFNGEEKSLFARTIQ